MRAKYLLVLWLLLPAVAHPRDAAPPLDLIELLGAADEDELNELDAALSEIESKRDKEPTRPREVKNEN